MQLKATQSTSSREVIVGARLPGVIRLPISSLARGMLYWQSTYFWAAKGGKMYQLSGIKGETSGMLTYNAFYSRGDKVNELLVRGMLRFDKDSGRGYDCIDGFETGRFHGFAGF